MAVGFRVLPRRRVVAGEWIERARTLPVANISDVMSRMASGGTALRPMHASGGMAGPALTVKTRPGDNLMVHKALDMAVAGDVIVVDAGGDLTNALFGEMMLAQAAKRRVAGIIIYGAIRDAAAIRANSLPVFAAGVTHRGPYKDGPGEINGPVAIGGMVIQAGDLVLGDDDGVLAVAFDDCRAVIEAAEAKQSAEVKQMAAIETGTLDRSWVDASLRRLGCEMP